METVMLQGVLVCYDNLSAVLPTPPQVTVYLLGAFWRLVMCCMQSQQKGTLELACARSLGTPQCRT
jgi:hypothetical protein